VNDRIKNIFKCYVDKIRVGNLKSRANAEALQIATRKNGFPRSWVLRTRVFVNLRKPIEKDSAELIEE